MKSFLRADFSTCSIFLIVLILALAALIDAELEQRKNRRARGGTSGIFAFPRVGRSDPSLSNNRVNEGDASSYDNMYPPSSEDYEEYPRSDIKRAGLIAFPRVGRNDEEMRKWAHLLTLQQALDKRTGPSATSGLWFGPRLGKRSADANQYKPNGQGQQEQY